MRRDDGELVRRTLTGEETAFAELVNRYRDAVCGMAYHYLGNFEDAQESFVRAYLYLKRLHDPQKFAPWLRRITSHVCTDFVQRRARALVSLEEVQETAMPPAIPSPEEDMERLAARMVVRETLGRLSEKTRLAVTLFYIDGYSHSEIADFLEIPVNTVRSRLRRGKKQLQEEMITMVTDVLKEGKPDSQFTEEVISRTIVYTENAVTSTTIVRSKGHKRHKDPLGSMVNSLVGNGLRDRAKVVTLTRTARRQLRITYIDATGNEGASMGLYSSNAEPLIARFKALAHLSPDVHAASQKGEFIFDYEGKSYPIAIEIIPGEQGENMRLTLPEVEGKSGSKTQNPKKAEEYLRKSPEIYQGLDTRGQGMYLYDLGSQNLQAEEIAQGKQYCEEALPLLEASHNWEWGSACRAMLGLVADITEERFPLLIKWVVTSVVLEKQADVVRYVEGVRSSYYDQRYGVSPALLIDCAYEQVSHLRKFLDVSVTVGGSWSGDTFSYSYQPLKTTVTVKSISERITVPAGAFVNCLLTEQVTIESDLPDDATERQKELNRQYRCGTRQAWYAPGVGLVQLHVRREDGAESLIQLKEYSASGPGEGYLPLAPGNSWTYGWVGVPEEYIAKEVYRVVAHEGDTWYLAHHAYLYKD